MTLKIDAEPDLILNLTLPLNPKFNLTINLTN